MQKISVKSPTRVDLAGGTLDLWPLYLFVGGAKTINVAIDVFSYVDLEPRVDTKINLQSADLNFSVEYADLEACLKDTDPRIKLLQSQIRYWRPKQGFNLKTRSDSPVGAGLGGSSSLTISMMKAFGKWQGHQFASNEQMVNVAHNIEAEVLHTPTGTQDYFPAISGGINVIDYGYNGMKQSLIKAHGNPFADHFLLVYTGKAHHSGLNNFEVMQKVVAKDSETLKALHDLKNIADRTVGAVADNRWLELPALFREEFAARVKLAKAFSSPEIEVLEKLTLSSGAEAVKICGAGGGGCVLLWVNPGRRDEVEKVCQKSGFQVLNARPVDL